MQKDIEDNKPHLCVPTLDGNAHVIPAEVFDKIVSGEMKITDMEDWEIITRTVFSEWLRGLETEAKARVYKAAVDQLADSIQRRCFMIKTDPTMLVYDATPGPWEATVGATNGGGRLIIESHDFGAIAATSKRGAPSTQSRLSPDSPYYRSSELAVIESNARLICAAPPLLKVAQKLLLWMEECMPACDFNQDDIDLYHELRQTIRTAGGFSSETHWWQGPCICDACGHAWQGVVEIPVEATGPRVPLECSECHQMRGGPA